MIRTITVLVVSSITAFAYGDPFQVVTPDPAFENQEGNGSAREGINPFRSQYLHHASQFASVPAGYNTIVGQAIRLDRLETEPVVATWDNLTILLATTNQDFLTDNFDSNYGSAPVVVFDGTSIDDFPVSDNGPPNPFQDPFIQFQIPFDYNPDIDGNLILEFTSTSGASSRHRLDGEFVPNGPITAASASSATASTATNLTAGYIITAFYFVPEPSTLFLAAFAVVGLLTRRQKKG